MLEIFVGDCEEQSMGVICEKFNKIFIDVVKNWGIMAGLVSQQS